MKKITLSKKEMIIFNLFSVVLAIGLTFLINPVYRGENVWILIATLLLTVFIHKVFHAIAYKIYGGKIEIGVKLPLCAYVRETSKKLYPAIQMIAILLFPAVLLTIILLLLSFIPGWYLYCILCVILNVSGACADIYYACLLHIKYRNCTVRDEVNGFTIIDEKLFSN